jgi:mono/diheme cytochrome c family protein
MAALAMVAALAACGPIQRGEPTAEPVHLMNASVRRGQLVFDAHCYKCHTNGEGGMGPVINSLPLPKFLMRFQVRNGLGVMPAFSSREISESELEDLLNYMVALRKQER